ncbi:MAG TPA: NAD(P)/FAD-dependent oxidoreductase [Streptosporangiaceae bacterium]|nr:NAD(P)/FAD-dependent oxidoreductase [Streptosporangiaceae bacterium]
MTTYAPETAAPRVTTTKADVLVVGAGPAGLSAAAELGRLGVAATVLERSDAVASSWRGRYDRLRLNTPRLTSALPGSRYPRGTAQFPTRDQVVGYLEGYAERRGLDVRFGVRVDRIDPGHGGWRLTTSAGQLTAREVVIATGFAHTPRLPDWPGRDRFPGRLLHSAAYRNPKEFRGAGVLVVGPGCSGLEIAYDLAQGGARRVQIAVRTQPNIMLRQAGGLPGDYPAMVLELLPKRIADAQARVVRRLTVGDLTRWGLTPPQEGIFARLERERKAPAIVDIEVIQAIRSGELEIVAGVESVDEAGVRLADGTTLQPDAIIAATGYTSGLDPIAGHLGVLGVNGVPQVHGGPAAAPGLRFIGYLPRPSQVGRVGREARRAARQIKRELAAAR